MVDKKVTCLCGYVFHHTSDVLLLGADLTCPVCMRHITKEKHFIKEKQMVKVKINEDRLVITGHANSGEKGHDLVCAAVSTLAQALKFGVNATFLEVVREKEGDLEYRFKPPANPAVMLVVLGNIKMITSTFDQLAKDYPDNIAFKME